MKIVHRDLASENILINEDTKEVKLIDFDLCTKQGEKEFAAGNPDFVNDYINDVLNRKGPVPQKVEITFEVDLFALSLCCFMLIGDKENRLIEMIDGERGNEKEKEKVISK